jgi:hypothetical protein
MDHDCFNMAIRMAVWNQAIMLNKQNYHFMDLKFAVSSYLLLLQNCFRIVYMLKYNCVKVKLCKKNIGCFHKHPQDKAVALAHALY